MAGWYRECSIIRHTTDIDIFLWASEYEKSIKKRFLGDKLANVFAQHGFVNDSLELRLWGWQCDAAIDMMFVFKYNETAQWNGMHYGSKKYR